MIKRLFILIIFIPQFFYAQDASRMSDNHVTLKIKSMRSLYYTAHESLKDLGIKNIRVTIEKARPNMIRNWRPGIRAVAHSRPDGTFTIFILPNEYISEDDIYHECVHIDQYIKGDLVVRKGYYQWKGDTPQKINLDKWHMLPYEQDAIQRTKKRNKKCEH